MTGFSLVDPKPKNPVSEKRVEARELWLSSLGFYSRWAPLEASIHSIRNLHLSKMVKKKVCFFDVFAFRLGEMQKKLVAWDL